MGDFSLDQITDLPCDLWIGGDVAPAGGGGRFDVVDPATDAALITVADGTVGDARAAVGAAHAAAAGWASTPPRERSEILRRAFELMTGRAHEIAHLSSLENGKALADARGETAYAAEFCRWYAEEAVRASGVASDLARGMRVSERLDAGMAGLNRGLVSDPAAPFGGTKQSGVGREGGHEGMLGYLESKYVAVTW